HGKNALGKEPARRLRPDVDHARRQTPVCPLVGRPSLEHCGWPQWRVVAQVETNSGSHNTICSLDGTRAYLAGLRSPLLTVVDVRTQKAVQTVGAFSAAIRPFTVNAANTLCFVNVNGLLGFEIGDLKTSKKLYRVEVENFKPGPTKRHGCPSH